MSTTEIYSNFLKQYKNFNIFDEQHKQAFLHLPIIHSISAILPILDLPLDYKDISNIGFLLNYKYVDERTAEQDNLMACLENAMTSSYLNLLEDKSSIIDCRQYGAALKKIQLCACRKVVEIILPDDLEMLVISSTLKPFTINSLSKSPNLAYLEITRSPNFVNFSEIQQLKNLKVLNLHNNKSLASLDFLTQTHSLQLLSISECPNLDILNNIEHLQKLKHLKKITLSAPKNKQLKIQQALPSVYINQTKFSDL